jgi:hypothetical protein
VYEGNSEVRQVKQAYSNGGLDGLRLGTAVPKSIPYESFHPSPRANAAPERAPIDPSATVPARLEAVEQRAQAIAGGVQHVVDLNDEQHEEMSRRIAEIERILGLR